MANTLEILKIDSLHPFLTEADDYVKDYRELTFFEASPVQNLTFTGLQVSLDENQAGFRTPNAAKTYVMPELTLTTVTCKFLDASWRIDYAAADADYRGKNHAFDMVSRSFLSAAFGKFTRQIWDGTSFNNQGFSGFSDLITVNTPIIGTVPAAALDYYKVFLVKTGTQDAQLCYGNSGNITAGPIYDTSISATATTGFEGYAQKLGAWAALSVQSRYSFGVAYIPKAITESDPGIIDDMLYDLISAFPIGFTPGQSAAFFCSRELLATLRKGRTATNPTGIPAPFPTEVAGIPIYTTEGIQQHYTAA